MVLNQVMRFRCLTSYLRRLNISKPPLDSLEKKQLVTTLYRPLYLATKPASAMNKIIDSFVRIKNDLTEVAEKEEIQESIQWLDKMLDYNLLDGKLNRGSAIISTFKHLVPDASEEKVMQAHAMAWCLEMIQASFLVADDIMDSSVTRRGKLCWYRKPEVGVLAINDSLCLLNASYVLMDKYLRAHPHYIAIITLMNSMVRKTVMGQTMDTLSLPPGETSVNLNKYTIERHATIVKYKTAFYTFSHPVRFALYLAGLTDPQLHAETERILLEMGHFFQIQDDFLDCFGDPAVTGKIGTDIEDGKCAWPVVIALSKATPQQKQILQENYGKKDAECVSRVKALYQELGIERLYHEFEDKEYLGLQRDITSFQASRPEIPKEIFTDYLVKIFKRSK